MLLQKLPKLLTRQALVGFFGSDAPTCVQYWRQWLAVASEVLHGRVWLKTRRPR